MNSGTNQRMKDLKKSWINLYISAGGGGVVVVWHIGHSEDMDRNFFFVQKNEDILGDGILD